MDHTDTRFLYTQKSAHHVIAFSGGIDSSVAAALIHNVLESDNARSFKYAKETATAVLGISPAVPLDQRDLARTVANTIGISLEEVTTTEGTDELYQANDGRACLACKTHLYDNLKGIARHYRTISTSEVDEQRSSSGTTTTDTILYNGTNADDLQDPTRLGLVAAQNFEVRSPLQGLSKNQVRAVGKHLGLPNWDHAASPCLRSRLAVGVAATEDHLKVVEQAEAFVKQRATDEVWDPRRSLRVRILSKNRAMIEVDDDSLRQRIQEEIQSSKDWENAFVHQWGFASVHVRRFKTGSVAPSPERLRSLGGEGVVVSNREQKQKQQQL